VKVASGLLQTSLLIAISAFVASFQILGALGVGNQKIGPNLIRGMLLNTPLVCADNLKERGMGG
jgi:hypothetical protein